MFTTLVKCTLVLAILSQVGAQTKCPGVPECSGNGVCDGSTLKCSCNTSYAGDDCSIALLELTLGQWKADFVEAWKWKYYYINNPTKDINLLVETKPAPGTERSLSDCDIYVKKDSMPSASDYTKANMDWGTKASLVVEKADIGRWYIGIYSNFLNCSYQVKASLTQCNSTCEHGTCNTASRGVCVCDQGWAGRACDTQVIQSGLELNKLYTGLRVDLAKWNYYYSDIPAQNTPPKFTVIVNTTEVAGESHDCDLYIRKGDLPTFLTWDYKDTTVNTNFAVEVPRPTPGRYYFGMYGFKPCSFNISIVTAEKGCPGQCSNHGDCDNGVCRCDPKFTGQSCETRRDPLQPGEIATGFVAQNAWNYYTYHPDPATSTVIHMVTLKVNGKDGDCDIYVKRGRNVTRFDFDYIDISLTNNVSLTIPGDSVGTDLLYIGLFGWGECSYVMTAQSSASCAAGCVHGNCTLDGECMCDDGWSGPKCDKGSQVLTNNKSENNQINAAGEWQYWRYTSTGKDFLIISMKELAVRGEEVGFLYLYVKEATQPTLQSYDFMDIDTNKAFHTVTITQNRPGPIEWVIGVLGSPFVNGPTRYTLIAWETPI